jgi:transcription antitermination factor NusA-like protein
VRVLIDAKVAGGVIGKGGDVIGKIREASGTWMDMGGFNKAAAKRVCTLKGKREGVAKCLHLVAVRLAEIAAGREEHDPQTAPTDLELVIVVPNSQVGSLIGKGGSRIKELRELGCHISISTDTLEHSTDKSVTVKGESEPMSKLLDEVTKYLASVLDRDEGIPFDPSAPYGGPPFDRYGGRDRDRYRDRDARDDRRDDYRRDEYRRDRYDDRDRRDYGRRMDFPDRPPFMPFPPHMRDMGFRGGGGGAEEAIVIPVPDQYAGAVIGRQGGVIKEIRKRSGCNIRIGESETGTKERMVTITGTREQNHVAMSMVYEHMARAQDRAY